MAGSWVVPGGTFTGTFIWSVSEVEAFVASTSEVVTDVSTCGVILAWAQSARVDEAFLSIAVEAGIASAGVLTVTVLIGKIDRAGSVGVTTTCTSDTVIWDAERSITVEVEESSGAGADVGVTIGGAIGVVSAWIGSARVKVADVFEFGVSGTGSFDFYGRLVVAVVAGPESVAVSINIACGVVWDDSGEAGIVARALSVVFWCVIDEAFLTDTLEVPASDFGAVGIGTTCRPVSDVFGGDGVVVVLVMSEDDCAYWWRVVA